MILSAHDLFVNGLVNLLPVIPPGAPLAPSSAIPQSAVGKVPGRRGANGVWSGFAWQHYQCELSDVEKWSADGANTGLKSDHFPALDIDVSDAGLAQIIADLAVAKLGAAPVRTGRAPKRLLVYRTDTPFSRMRLWVKRDGISHLVEVLGRGNQFIASGVHPGTLKHYEWDRAPKAGDLVTISAETVSAFFDELASLLNLLYDVETEREGDGRITERTVAANQTSLMAPSLEKLREAVRLTPNTIETREEWIRYGYAIRAAAGSDEQAAYEIFAEFSERWENGTNSPEVVRQDFRRMRPPYGVGWGLISEMARPHGFADADEFTPLEPAPDDVALAAAARSDQDLADIVVKECAGEMRFLPEQGRFIVYDGTRWEPDAELLAEDLVKKTLRRVADRVARSGATAKEMDQARAEAKAICSAARAAAVLTLTKSERAISMTVKMLDRDPWLLGVPGGMVDLRTGTVLPPNPDALISKITSVAPARGDMPVFDKFLSEVTGNDGDFKRYLQKLAGYALTGDTSEQNFTVMWGSGGNGKSLLVNAWLNILGDYGTQAAMSTFIASNQNAHSTELASLMGSRLVVASETNAGQRLDEAKIKSLSGGDRISARFIQQDSVVFRPQFKIVLTCNHRPEIRNLDAAIKRRVHLLPFRFVPTVVDRELGAKLEREHAQILQWMIDGALAWQAEGLTPLPAVVERENAAYFQDSDPVGQFIEERTDHVIGSVASTTGIYDAWREWCGRNGEYPGSGRRLDAMLAAKGWVKVRTATTRGYADVTLKQAEFAHVQ